MSQYTYRHRDLLILAGWDRPLQYHFLTVERFADNDSDDEPSLVYCNLDDPTLPRGAMTPAQVIAKLKELEITYPANLETELEMDKLHNVGNRTFSYGVL